MGIKNPVKFFSEVRQEGSKVTWAGKNETISLTAVVLIMVTIAALFFLFADWVIFNVIQLILNF